MQNSLLSITLAVITGLSLLFNSGCGKTDKVEAQAGNHAEVTTVAVAKATMENLSHGIVLTGEFRPYQEIEVMAKVAGYVKKINVDVGDRVQAGQLLATLEIPEMADDLNRAKAGVEQSQAEVARARDEIRRAESGYQIARLSFERLSAVSKQRPGLVAQQEIDDAQSKALMAEAQVSGAKSNLAAILQQVSVRKADLSRVNTMFEYTRVTAPFAGVITKRFANTGSMIQAGTSSQTQAMPLVRLSQNSLLRLTLPVPESAVPGVHIGQQVDVRVPTLNRIFPGKVARFSDKVQLSTRTMETEVDVPNSSLVLIPGMYAEVNLNLARSNDVVAVPVAALDTDEQADGGVAKSGKVMLVSGTNHLEVRKVTLGMETANHVEIRSGLKNGDLVVIGNRASLVAGQEVRPKIIAMVSAREDGREAK
jgi:RND family efflux transporter MFP subunit